MKASRARTNNRQHISRATRATVLIAVVWLVAGPRVDLIAIGGSSLRLEDFVFVALAIYVVSRGSGLVFEASRVRAVMLVLFTALTSALIAFVLGRVEILPAFLYAVRPVEYWIVLPAVYFALASASWDRARRGVEVALTGITLLQVGVAALQYFGFDIGFSKFSIERAAGLTAGPYELGAIMAMLSCYWMARRKYFLVLAGLAGLVISQSRVSLVAFAVGALLILWFRRSQPTERARPRPLAVMATTMVVVGCILLLPSVANVVAPTVERVQETDVGSAWQEARATSSSISDIRNSGDFNQIAYVQIGEDVTSETALSDASNVVRFYRWQLLLDRYWSSPWTVLFGVGPSFAGPSVDGGLLRVMMEFGLAGAVSWALWFRGALRGGAPWLAGILATILVGSIFIDVLFALRPMVLFWFLAAVAILERSKVEGRGPNAEC